MKIFQIIEMYPLYRGKISKFNIFKKILTYLLDQKLDLACPIPHLLVFQEVCHKLLWKKSDDMYCMSKFLRKPLDCHNKRLKFENFIQTYLLHLPKPSKSISLLITTSNKLSPTLALASILSPQVLTNVTLSLKKKLSSSKIKNYIYDTYSLFSFAGQVLAMSVDRRARLFTK